MITHDATDPLSAALTARFGCANLTWLGRGGEGPVFRGGDRVFKCLVHESRWRPAATLLRSLPARLRGYATLPEVEEVTEVAGALVIVSRYAPHAPLGATRPEEWLTFLREMQDAGLAHRDVKPENFVRAGEGLRLVDLGADLREWTPGRAEDMARRCFLSWRFAPRPDLRDLIRECQGRRDHPALLGIEHFVAGLDRGEPFERFDALLTETCRQIGARRVLDYGAGSGWLSERLAADGRDVTAVGVSAEGVPRLRATACRVTDDAGLARLVAAGERFDLVVFSRVACKIGDDAVVRGLLGRLRGALAPDGRLVVAVCNPFFADVRRTAAQDRQVADLARPGPQVLAKSVLSTGRTRQDVYRRWDQLARLVARAGFREIEAREVPGSDLDRACPASEFLISVWRPGLPPAPVSLLIKACAMDHEVAPACIRHLVRQLDAPRPFAERVVVVDSRADGFARQYAAPDRPALLAGLERLRAEGVIDRIVEAPDDPAAVQATYARWFGPDTACAATDTHAANGQPIHAILHGIDACALDRILSVDLDLLVAKRDEAHDWLGDLLGVLDADRAAVFVSPSVRRSDDAPPTCADATGKPWRVDAVATLLDRARLRRLLPVPAPVVEGRLGLPWHRLFDAVVLAGRATNYRRHDRAFGWIHVPNSCKQDPAEWFLRMDRVEDGVVPAAQDGHADLLFDDAAWWGPSRREPFVLVVVGRDVPCGKARRCVDSILAQDRRDFGLIVVDDASTTELPEYLRRVLAAHRDRATLVRARSRRGGLYNLDLAVRRLCTNPESVIVTVDLDDALIGPGVLTRLAREYASGADLTVGSMFGTDKGRHYTPDFADPRGRASNLWQHLRSFKKRLFDAIPPEAFRLDGRWIDEAYDWAFMVPLVELAVSPRYVPEELYYYEPTGPKSSADRERRDAIIADILAKPAVARPGGATPRPPLIAVAGSASAAAESVEYRLAYAMGRVIADRGWRLLTGGLGGVMEAACAGARSSPRYQPGGAIGVLPGLDPTAANAHVDLVLATGLGDVRNHILANADAVVLVGGGAGTLSEAALAWSRRRLIVALGDVGWAGHLAGARIDGRPRKVAVPDDKVYPARTPEEAADIVAALLPVYAARPRNATDMPRRASDAEGPEASAAGQGVGEQGGAA